MEHESACKARWFGSLLEELKSEWPNGLKDRVFVITGTSSGIGFIAAKVTGELGGRVLLLNRQSKRAEAALEKLRELVPKGEFEQIDCDLEDFESVRKAAEQVKSRVAYVNCLACNAGILTLQGQASKNGFDRQMQVNHLSHFLLTKELFPLLEAAGERFGDARVVQHTSMMRKGSSLRKKYLEKDMSVLGGDDAKLLGFASPGVQRYRQAKLASALFAQSLRDKLEGSKVKSLACHPGIPLRSGFSKTVFEEKSFSSLEKYLVKSLGQAPEDGALGLLRCMLAKKDHKGREIENGAFFGPSNSLRKLKTEAAGPAVRISEEYSKKQKQLVWEASEAAIQEHFVLQSSKQMAAYIEDDHKDM